MRVLAAFKDTGGMNEVLPIVVALRMQGVMVDIVTGKVNGIGPAFDVLHRAGVPFYDATNVAPEVLLAKLGIPDALVTSTDADGGIGRDVVPLLRARGVPTVAAPGLWGGALNTENEWKNLRFRPDHVVVNDQVGFDLVLRAWPEYEQARVHILGYASLDALFRFDLDAAKRRVYEHLGVTSPTPTVYFSGQLRGTGQALEHVVRALADLGVPSMLWYKEHPRLDRSDAQLNGEAMLCDLALTRLPAYVRPYVVRGAAGSDLNLIAAANVTVSMFSTALLHAADLRKPAISVLFPGSRMQTQYLKESGGLLDEHPLVALGAAIGPKNQTELKWALGGGLNGSLSELLRPAQEKHVIVDGKNADRIARFVISLKR